MDDVLSNKAYIYFDFNSPIITNEATTQFFTLTSLSSASEGFTTSIYPNPVREHLTVEMGALDKRKILAIQIFSSDGKLIHQLSTAVFSYERLTIPTMGLSPGLYIVQLS